MFILLAVIFVIKQHFKMIIHYLKPYLRNVIAAIKMRRLHRADVQYEDVNRYRNREDWAEKALDLASPSTKRHPQYMRDHLLADFVVNKQLSKYYAETVNQFGFLILFGVSFPLGIILIFCLLGVS